MKIDEWIEEATGGIVLAKDRRLTARELSDHFSDHRDALLESGMSDAEAEEAALAALGDPKETRQLLRAACQPVLSLLIKAANVLVILTALGLFAVVAAFGTSLWEQYRRGYPNEIYVSGDPYFEPRNNEILVSACGDGPRQAAGYTFEIRKASVNTNPGADSVRTAILLLKVSGPFYLPAPNILEYYLEADDVSGLHYGNDNLRSVAEARRLTPFLQCSLCGTGMGCWYYLVTLFQPDPQGRTAPTRLELSYQHAGTSFTLHLHTEEDPS